MNSEYCCECESLTGRAGRGEDSLYYEDLGPFCSDCFRIFERGMEVVGTAKDAEIAALKAKLEEAEKKRDESFEDGYAMLTQRDQLQAKLAAAERRMGEIADRVEKFKPGWTCSLEPSGGLIRDKDGPWGLNSHFGKFVRSLFATIGAEQKKEKQDG